MNNNFSLTEQARQKVKGKIKKKVMTVALLFIKPFIVPLLILLVFLTLISSITDVLYIAFDNDDKVDMTKELAYYDTVYEKENDKEEVMLLSSISRQKKRTYTNPNSILY